MTDKITLELTPEQIETIQGWASKASDYDGRFEDEELERLLAHSLGETYWKDNSIYHQPNA